MCGGYTGEYDMSVRTTPWYNKGRTGELLLDCVEQRLYNEPTHNWTDLANDARRVGLSESEVYEFLREVRDGGL